MPSCHVLICSSSRKVALVQAFQNAAQSLALDSCVYAADVNPLSATLYGQARAVLSPRSDSPHYLSWLLDFCLQHKIKLIIPTRDEELVVLAEAFNDFQKHGILINVSSPQTVHTCHDKFKFNAFCEQHKFSVPVVYKLSKDVVYPCFIKGRFGKGGKLAYKVNDAKQMQAFEQSINEGIVQEYVSWPEYTVDYFADFSGCPISVVPRLRILTMGGESFVGKTVHNKNIIDATIALAKSLHLVGHNTVQLFFEPESHAIKFIEVNPRFGGAAALSIAAGADTPKFLLQLAMNQVVKPIVGDFTQDLYMLRYTQDVFVKQSELKHAI